MDEKRMTDFDRAIAKRLIAARMACGLSQEAAGDKLGKTFQQIQKYEKAGRSDNGGNRISCGALAKLAELYGRPVAWFFQDIERKPGESGDDEADVFLRMAQLTSGYALAEEFVNIVDADARSVLVKIAGKFSLIDDRE